MNENVRCYLDIHVLQTVPPSCVNRDDTGSPKTARYGGVTRARVSSQSWKHAIRNEFNELFVAEDRGLRTKYVFDLLCNEIKGKNPDADSEKLAKTALDYAGLKLAKDNKLDALFFISREQIKELARLAVEGNKDEKAYKAALSDKPSIDMVLFGRMAAKDPSLNYDAAVQVAHSISTHAVHNEYDYFTAVDDCRPKDNAGSGHIGTVEFNSATLYRYATMNIKEVYAHLGDDTIKAVRGFTQAFIKSMPTGKQNTFANRTLPDAVYITLRDDQPANLCGAFEKPIYSDNGYVQKSKEALAEYAASMYKTYAKRPFLELATESEFSSMAEVGSLEAVINTLIKHLSEKIL